MCRFKIGIVVITIAHVLLVFGELSIDQKIREGNREREKDIRLIGRKSAHEGRVEIRYNGTWGTVCDDGFNKKAAKVACHMLGFKRRGARPYSRAAFGKGEGPIWLDEIDCSGKELSLKDCKHSPLNENNCVHKEDAGVKCKRGKKVDIKRMLTLELDMVIEKKERHRVFDRNRSNRKIAIKDPSNYWNRKIFYMIGDGIDAETEILIRDALDEWQSYTCLDFSKDDSGKKYNKIVFTSNKNNRGCASAYVGMIQGSQEIHIAKNCLHRDIILHEVGHALGLYHEQNRADRDKFIKINYENIVDDNKEQFQKMPNDEYEDFKKPYDYKSIMHYGQFFFSKNASQDLITIKTLKPEFQDIIGKAKHPSFLDYKIVNDMYKCASRCHGVQCTTGGFLGKNCHCYCEGNDESTTVITCFEKNDCPKPSINLYLFDVLDKRFKNSVNLSRDSYPDGTVFNIYSTNINCSYSTQFQCDNGTWEGQTPNCTVELELKLTDGADDKGIVEVILNGQRGLICDDDWDDNDATVACRMMGFTFGKAMLENISTANESLFILMDEVKCSGMESMLSECMHNGFGKHDCQHTEAAKVKCFINKGTEHTDDLSQQNCGKIPLNGSKRRKRALRIIGGNEAVKGMYPWQVEIQRMRGRWGHWCGGTIISSHWILSAAHCFGDLTNKYHGRSEKMDYKDFRVILGDHDLTQHDEYEQTFQIEYLVKHWLYSEKDQAYADYDIALLKIDSKSSNGAEFNDFVQPACLPAENEPVSYGKHCEVSGWGKSSESGDISNKLKSVKVPIINEMKCKIFYDRYSIDTQRMLCAGDVNIGTDSCQGDSGGPLVCNISGINIVIGITSWGEGCGRSNAPGVYTKVSTFMSWIKDQITLHDSKGCVLYNITNGRFMTETVNLTAGETIKHGESVKVECDDKNYDSNLSIECNGGAWKSEIDCSVASSSSTTIKSIETTTESADSTYESYDYDYQYESQSADNFPIDSQSESKKDKGCTLSKDRRYMYKDREGKTIKPGSIINDGTTLNVTCTIIDLEDYYNSYVYDDEHNTDLASFPTITCANNTLSQIELDCPVVTGEAETCLEFKHGNVIKENGYYMVSCDKGFSLNLTIAEDPKCTCKNGTLKSVYGDQIPYCIPDNCTIPYEFDWSLSVTYRNSVSLTGGSVVAVGEFVYLNCSKADGPNYEPFNRRFTCSNGLWTEAERGGKWKLGYNGEFPKCRAAICEPNCTNGGVCYTDDTCRCQHFTDGKRCENVICNEICNVNGGKCIVPGKCQCPQGKSGKNCEQDGCLLPKDAAKYKNSRTVFTRGESLTNFSCPAGFIVSSRDGMTCQNGGWSNIVKCVEAATYLISVKTGNIWKSGTNAKVNITLHGLKGSTDIIYLQGSFEANDLDETRVPRAKDVRPITSVVIGHDGSGFAPGWYLEYVSIYVENMEEYYVFRHNDWLAEEKEVRLPRQGIDQQRCIASFDSGNSWWPIWSSIKGKDMHYFKNRRGTSVRGCKQACIDLQKMACVAVTYHKSTKTCWGFAVSDRKFFNVKYGRWDSPVYIRKCLHSD